MNLGTEPALGKDPLLPAWFRVSRFGWDTEDTFTFELETKENGGFRFEPGQFNMLYAHGAGESAISISGDPRKPERLVHTVRRVGAVTGVLSRLRRGDWLGVRGPYGRGWPLEVATGKHLLIVAGGIGLAPLRPAILHALAHLGEFASVSVMVGARTPADLVYGAELARWKKRIRVEVSVDRGDPEWTGHTGVVTKLLPDAVREPRSTVAFLCGPEVMLRFAARELDRLGVPENQIFVSTERNMKCGVGLCGHCQLGPFLICRDGPTFSYDRIGKLLLVREL